MPATPISTGSSPGAEPVCCGRATAPTSLFRNGDDLLGGGGGVRRNGARLNNGIVIVIKPRFVLASATLLAGVAPGASAFGATPEGEIATIERQIDALKEQLARVRHDEAARRAETARAEAVAHEARLEAQQANRRAIALSGSTTFGGTASGALVGPANNVRTPGVFRAEDLPSNGVGPHGAGTGGEQQASALGPYGSIQLGNVSVTLGGFVEALGIERTRNETSDFASNYGAIPYPQSPAYHEPEFRGTARQSRFSMLIEGKPSPAVRVAAYLETDFGVAGVSSNSNESNSYALRLRQAYATYDNADLGFHVLGGQAFSLVVLDRVGITPRQESVTLNPDGQFVVGFNWARQWQLRFVQELVSRRLWAGLSVEQPQTLYSVATQNVAGVNNVGGVIGGVDNYDNLGGSLLNSTANYSPDIAPDVIAKLAADPAFGHYEIYGIARIMNARETLSAPFVNSGRNRTVLAGGGGAGMLLPIIGPKLVFQATAMVGQGIGRYGSGQLPDATINQNGTPIPIPEIDALVGLVSHPSKQVDLYAYVGTEQEAKRSFNERIGGTTDAFGYGNGGLIDTGCETEGSTAACSGQTRGLVEGVVGGWWRFLHGPYGTMEIGPAWEYIRRTAFQGTSVATVGKTTVDTNVTPKTDENVILFSFRYLPFL